MRSSQGRFSAGSSTRLSLQPSTMSADRLAELGADLGEHGLAAAVFRGVVQQRPDRLVLGGAVLEGKRGDAEDVRDVRDVRSLAPLALVHPCGEDECGRKGVHAPSS